LNFVFVLGPRVRARRPRYIAETLEQWKKPLHNQGEIVIGISFTVRKRLRGAGCQETHLQIHYSRKIGLGQRVPHHCRSSKPLLFSFGNACIDSLEIIVFKKSSDFFSYQKNGLF
jgi:hypothetical protein